jgi:hypothetical protein
MEIIYGIDISTILPPQIFIKRNYSINDLNKFVPSIVTLNKSMVILRNSIYILYDE